MHKGVDVFAKKGTSVHSATWGIVLLATEYGKGGKFVVTLGPKWRLHYYAHLDEIRTRPFAFVTQDTEIGTTPAHLHYGIGTPRSASKRCSTLIPLIICRTANEALLQKEKVFITFGM